MRGKKGNIDNATGNWTGKKDSRFPIISHKKKRIGRARGPRFAAA
jgi:phage terminase large subunit-like protein